MSHLPIERLAALADESPAPAELAHLASCEECASERAAMVALVDLARGEQARLGTPLSRWETLAPALRREAVPADGWQNPIRRWRPLVAAAVLIAAGVAAGRYSAGASLWPTPSRASAPVAKSRADSQPGAFSSITDARAARARYETLYQNAAAYLAAHDTTELSSDSPAAMRTRLAALDRVDRAMRDAMHEAPYDPVINGYYLTTLGQREATLRQLNTVLPAGMRIDSY